MPFRSVTDPQHHAMLNAALEDFCRTGNILAGTPEFEEGGRFIMSLYCNGAITAEALAAALENRLQGKESSRSSEWLHDR